MKIRQADEKDLNTIKNITHRTIKEIYPKYYHQSAVEFFLLHHSEENILKSILTENVFIMKDDNAAVATCGYKGNHVLRLFVMPEYQGKGYGSAFMEFVEKNIGKEYPCAVLDASLAACIMYEKRGYKTVCHCRERLDDGFLVYEMMEKFLNSEG